jgi:bifunctional non-homologous end joining protein LigD
MVTEQVVVVDERRLKLTNLDRVLWPDVGITKGDLIRYHASVAERLLPHLRGRPLTLARFPRGITGDMFYQKNTPSHAPDWLPTHTVTSPDGQSETKYLLAEEPAALLWLANLAAIEIHPWLSTVAHPASPTCAIVDVDPAPKTPWNHVVEMAELIRLLLAELKLIGFPKLSGATGIHIYIPLAPGYSFAQTSGFVGFLGEMLVKARPEKATNERLVRNRQGKIYIDHLQNLPGKTIVAPYIPRPIPGAPVSAPVTWSELREVTPDQFTLKNPRAVLQRPPDFDSMYDLEQSLDHVLPLFS